MTSENLIELFEKSLKNGRRFKADTKPMVGRYMEFSFVVGESENGLSRLGTISVLCEFNEMDYYENNINKSPFGIYYYIKYATNIEGVSPFKFRIESETFSRLLKPFRVFERKEADQKENDKIIEFKNRMKKIEEEYGIEVSSLQRKMVTEKTLRYDKTAG